MSKLIVPRFMLSGACTGVGKALLGIGLVHEFRRQGIGVSCCVLQPNLLQALVFRRISGRYVRCLDDRLMTSEENLLTLSQAGIGSDIVMILGAQGLFDGSGGRLSEGSDADFAKLTRSPVLFTVDASGFGRSVTALIRGYADFSKEVNVSGIILNRVDDQKGLDNRKDFFQDCFKDNGLYDPVGVVPEMEVPPDLPARTFSQQENSTSLAMQFFVDVSRLVHEHIDLDRVMTIANSAPEISLPNSPYTPLPRRTKIAVSDDSCFSVCFQDNLDLLRYFGANIVAFSPLADETLPQDIGGLYLTGAYMAQYGAELANNESMKNSIRDFVNTGGVLYAEGGGCAFLCEEFLAEVGGELLPGVGIIKGRALASDEPKMLYREIETIEESVIGGTGLVVNGIDTEEWKFVEKEPAIKIFRIAGLGTTPMAEGFSPGAQVLATFSFCHFGSNFEIAKNIVDAAEVVKRV